MTLVGCSSGNFELDAGSLSKVIPTNYTDRRAWMCGSPIYADDLFRSLRSEIDEHLRERQLYETSKYLDMETPTHIGKKSSGPVKLYRYRFTDTKPGVLLVGEGGIDVWVDACARRVVNAYQWRY